MRVIRTANLIYAATLIIGGILLLVGNIIEQGDWHTAASIILAFGLGLPFLSRFEYIANRIIMHVLLVFVILIGVMTTFLFLYGYSEGDAFTRERIIYMLMSLASLVLTVIYVARLLDLKRIRRLKRKS